MSGVNFNFNNSNAITGFDNPGQISTTSRIAIGDQPDSSGKAGWGRDSFPGMEKFSSGVQEQLQSMTKELATAYEDVMARIDQSTKDGAPSHVLDNLKRVASDILAGAKELLQTIEGGPGVKGMSATFGAPGTQTPSKLDGAMATAQTIMDGIRSNMGELVKISKDPGIYFPDVSESAKPETSEEISADIKGGDVADGVAFNLDANILDKTEVVQRPSNSAITETSNANKDAAVNAMNGETKSDEASGAPKGGDNIDGTPGQDGLAGNKDVSGRSASEWKDMMMNDPQAFGAALDAMPTYAAQAIITKVQEFTQLQNRIMSAMSNIMMTEHQTQKAIIQNFRV